MAPTSRAPTDFDPKNSQEWEAVLSKTRVNLKLTYSVNAWVKKFYKSIEEADYHLLKKDYEQAYISYVISLSIYVECLQKQPDFVKLKEKNEPELKKMKQETNRCLKNAEEAKKKILKSIKDNHDRKATSVPASSFENTHRYGMNLPKPPTASEASARVDPPRSSRGSIQPPVNPYSQSSSKSIKLSDPLKALPVPSKIITPEALVPILNSYRVNQSPTVLFMDVRSPHNFWKERMSVIHQVNIDPIILTRDIGSNQIEEHLRAHSSDPSNLFHYRDRFDYVVILDEESTRALPPTMMAGGSQETAIHNLIQAITEYEPSKLLKNYPLLLVGGIAAWKKHTGAQGIMRTEGEAPSMDGYANRSQVISPARSKTIVKTLDEFFQRQPELEEANKPSMQFPYPLEQDPPAPFSSPIQRALSSLNGTKDGDGSSHSIPDVGSPTDSPGKTSLRTTVFDNPLYGFTPSRKDFQNFLKEEPPKSLEAIYQPPPGVPLSTPEPILKPTKAPPPIPPKPKNILAARPKTPPLVSSLSYAMNIGTTGLKNLGNTCYMNSIIQCINGTIPLARYFLDGSYKRHINRENPLGSGGALVEAFEELVRGLWTEGASYVSPTKFKASVGKISEQFKGSDQQDSQEFLNFFLDGLHEDLNLVKQRPPPDEDDDDYLESLPDQQASDLAWEKYLARNNSIIVSLFQGQFKSRLQCTICHKTSTTYNTFMSLSLPIPSKKTPVNLLDCLNLFVQEETLDGDNAWNCPRCKRPCPSTKRLTISRLPDVLLIHLKRFSYEGPFRNKLDALVDFPLRGLNLSSYVPPSAPKSSILSPKGTPIGNSYDLYGVSNHFGSLTGGHYTASVRSGHGGKWHYFDDSRVTTIGEKEAVTKAAYNLFYVRTNRDTAHL